MVALLLVVQVKLKMPVEMVEQVIMQMPVPGVVALPEQGVMVEMVAIQTITPLEPQGLLGQGLLQELLEEVEVPLMLVEVMEILQVEVAEKEEITAIRVEEVVMDKSLFHGLYLRVIVMEMPYQYILNPE